MEERTLMQDICEVVQLANGSHLSGDFWGNATPLLERLGRRLDLTPVQTMLFAVLIELSDDRKIVLKQLAEFLGCRKVELLNHAADFEELIRRQLIRRRRSGSAEPDTYRIPKMVLEALQAGKKFTPPPICGLTIDQFFVRLGKLISYTSQQEMSQTELAEELQQLIDRNQQLEFCCHFREIAQSLHIWDTLVFAQCCNLYVNNRDDHIGWHDIEVLFDDEWAARCEKDALLARYSELFDLNILENAPDSGMFGNREAFRLTDKAKTTLFSEILIQLQSPRSRKELIIASSLTPKKLWFNPGEQAKIDRLGLLLEAERFNAVRQRLWQNGMRQGFACLFYGSPGTGKTESVYQLARQSGRDIMQVDISETKSMWFGESEKHLKEIFDRYRGYVRDCDPAPILLFNEADAVLGRRRTTMGGSLDQTENAMQNILLQEIERLDGILIATTNLTQNLDQAFERRFLYKIKFCRPTFETRRAIWQTMLPSLKITEVEELSRMFDLSGGQIENVIRKYTADYLLTMEPNAEQDASLLDNLYLYCREELHYDSASRKRIGY